MNPESGSMRSSPKPSPSKTGLKDLGSYNVCYISTPNLIQDGLAGWREEAATTRAAIEARFWSHVKKSDGCWLWTANVVGPARHGQFTYRPRDRKQRHVYAHRLSWVLAYGPIPAGLKVCHHCDTPQCVRPAHLFLGTQADNVTDASRKGRLRVSRHRRIGLADRLAIYHMPDRPGVGIAMALHYGITEGMVSRIRRGQFVGAPREQGVEHACHCK